MRFQRTARPTDPSFAVAPTTATERGLKNTSRPRVTPNRHRPGARNFFRSRPALLSTWQPTQLVGVGLALAVVAVVAGVAAVLVGVAVGTAAVVTAGALEVLNRESRG